nr:uncharacterized protein LOC113817937 [Penaeus vannamei]
MKTIALVALLLGAAAAVPGLRQRRDSNSLFFELPADADLILGGINTGFECGDLPYGYYADQANSCAVFHVCLPYIDNDLYITRHFSFLPVRRTPEGAKRGHFEEGTAPRTSESNEYFGRENVNFLEKIFTHDITQSLKSVVPSWCYPDLWEIWVSELNSAF